MTSLIRNNHILFFARLISLIFDWSIPTIGFIEFIDDRCKQCIRTDIIKLTCNRSKNRKLLLVFMEEQVTAFILLAYLAKCILRATLFKLIEDRKSIRLNSSHVSISYAVFCLKKKKIQISRM